MPVDEQLNIPEAERLDFECFQQFILRKTGIDLRQYKSQQMHRRLAGLVDRANLKTFKEYYQLLERDPAELAVFLDRLTINVSELFRNPEKWRELREKALPELLKRRSALRVWSAGCSFGAEPYTLAMLLDEIGGARHTLIATDIDRTILAKAQRGIFSAADVREVPDAFRSRYLRPSGAGFEVVPSLRERISFRQHNLLSDRFDSDFDLIVCRNVVIYFTEAAKDDLFRRFTAALRVGGVLFLGSTERIFNYKEIGLSSTIPFFYTRVQ